MNLIKQAPLMALVIGLGYIGIASGFKNAGTKLEEITYHISSIDPNGNYIVTTEGTCDGLPVLPCEFTTEELPDQEDGTFSPAFLAEKSIVPSLGTYTP